jgi:Family of unknown function (DUF6011)
MASFGFNHDEDDDLSDLIGREPVNPTLKLTERAPADFKPVLERMFTEKCTKCGGSGRFRTYTGRDGGPCFTCNGSGNKTFKTAPETRAKTATKAQERAQEATQWQNDHAEEITWLRSWCGANPGSKFTYPAEMLAAISAYGKLSPAQLTGVQNCIARDAQRQADRAAQQAQRRADAPPVDVSKIEKAFAHARRIELERKPNARGVWNRPLKLRAEGDLDITVEPGKVGGKWENTLFVQAFDGRKLGMVQDGKFLAKFECTKVETDAVIKACSDPHAAVKAWCQAYSECQVCGRTLTNAKSIEESMGPVCAAKYGW